MPEIGTDRWVAEVESRRVGRSGPWGAFIEWMSRRWLWFFAIVAVVYPFVIGGDFGIRVGVNALLLAMLAIGLNVVVGYTGLLDLGYVAYYGLGAYGYAFLASDQFDIHLPTLIVVGIVALAVFGIGLILGQPARRLVGDYLAILTLFFLQVFVELALNLDRLDLPFLEGPLSITGGPNGIAGVDPMSIFGFTFGQVRDYYFLLLVLVVLLILGVTNLARSRTGVGWRAIREDTLAAEHMTIPSGRLKVLAYAFGAAVAAISGTVFAAVQLGVFPQNFTVTLLIVVYAALVLGGEGSIPGALVGALIIAMVPELLRNPTGARLLFYGGLAVAALTMLRPRRRLLLIVPAVGALGFAVRGIVAGLWPSLLDADAVGLVDRWLLRFDPSAEALVSVLFVVTIAVGLAIVATKGRWREALIVLAVYLLVLVWENRLVDEPSITRQLLFGALLVVLMVSRPHGLLGRPRVEVV